VCVCVCVISRPRQLSLGVFCYPLSSQRSGNNSAVPPFTRPSSVLVLQSSSFCYLLDSITTFEKMNPVNEMSTRMAKCSEGIYGGMCGFETNLSCTMDVHYSLPQVRPHTIHPHLFYTLTYILPTFFFLLFVLCITSVVHSTVT
jgi:hypothetical protein